LDWIDAFISDTTGMKTAERFQRWAAIGIVAGALERRVWTETDNGIVYPNMFTLLCGNAGSGKSLMVNFARKFWAMIAEMKIAPDNPNQKTFLTALENSERSFVDLTGELHTFSAMSVASTEMGVLIAKYDPQFIQHLSDLWDNKDKFTAPRETTKSIDIVKPTVNILAGATPAYLGDLFPDVAWEQGFTARLIFIYGEKPPRNPNRNAFAKRKEYKLKELETTINQIFNMIGEFVWADAAQEAHNAWLSGGMLPQPDFFRLLRYNDRREVFMYKLSMISAASRTRRLLVELEDFERAKSWLLEAEAYMPDVFRAMKSKSDEKLIQELYWEVWKIWGLAPVYKRPPIHKNKLWEILQDKTPSNNIQRVIDAAINAGYLKRTTYTDYYEPRSKLDGEGRDRE
jgi:Protein of unknown function (DUF3987)